MPDSNQARIQQLQTTIAALEAQRPLLGDAVVETALAPLREQLAALKAPAPPSAPTDERRILTVLFTDVAGSTTMGEQLDPEDVTRLMNGAFAFMNAAVARHGGTVARLMGDAILAFFGAQVAHEDDAEQAVRTGLEIQAAAAEYAQDVRAEFGIGFQVRVGINTGPVLLGVVGDEHKTELTAMGDTTNVAARMESAAPPGGILISHETYRYVRGIFDVTPQPPIAVKGKREPVKTYLVRRAKARPFRRVARGVAGVESPTVGREYELKTLQEAYEEAFEGRGLVWAQLLGEPGIGKSRLLSDLNDWIELRDERVWLLRARATLSNSHQPYALVRSLWFDRFQIAEDAPLLQAEAKWVARFKELWGSGAEPEVEERAHTLGLLIGLPFQSSPYIGAMREDPTQVRGRALVVSIELLERIRTTAPVVLLLEDLQWADASSWDYIQSVVLTPNQPAAEGQAREGVFVLATARAEWHPHQALRVIRPEYHYVEILLSALNQAAMRELMAQLVRRVEGMPPAVVDDLVARAEGMPYYAEELVNWFIDRGIIDAGQTPWRFAPQRLKDSPLPVTLQHLLLTRLAGLSELERAALQRGAIFGRHFWSGGVESLGIRESESVLAPLQPRGLVEPQPDSAFEGEREWSFHHNLLRDVTYESVLKQERATWHRAAARWLEEQAKRAERLDEFAGLLGEQLERAGEPGRAAEWYLQAAEHAALSSALEEAKRFFDRALELLPPAKRELRWRALLGREAVLDLRGELEAQKGDIDALLALAVELDDAGRQAEATFRSSRYFRALGDFRAGVQASEEAIAAAQRTGNRTLELRANALLPLALTRLGQHEAAGRAAERTLELMRGVNDDATAAQALARLSGHYTESGDISRSAELEIEVINRARRIGDRRTEALAQMNLGVTYSLLGLYKQARAGLESGLQVCQAIGDRTVAAYCLQNLGYAYWRSGDVRTARRTEEQALREFVATGDAFIIAATRLYLGFIEEQAEDLQPAGEHLTYAYQEFTRLGVNGAATEARAEQARCALALGRLEQARQMAEEAWTYISEHGSQGMESPLRVFFGIAEVFDALGLTSAARAATEAGYRELMSRADKISRGEWRRSFLENIEEHRALVEMWERLGGSVSTLPPPQPPDS